VDRLHPVECRGRVGQLAGTVIEHALAAAHPAEIEAQRREPPLLEHVKEIVHDRIVHRAAELRMRVQDDGDRRLSVPRRLHPALDASRGAGENHFWHRQLSSLSQ
jgi:hypothetical protein